jgi:hypothetical protein
MWMNGDIASPFLTSVLGGGEWSASRPGHFISPERATVTHWIGDWVGLGAGLDAMEKKIAVPCRETNLEFLVAQLVALRTSWTARYLISIYKILLSFSQLRKIIILKARISIQECEWKELHIL